MKILGLSVLLLFSLALVTTAAQQPAGRLPQPNFVFDDDGGAVQIVPAGLTSSGAKKFHGGRVMTSVQQVTIFLGGGWGDAQTRAREAALSDLLSGAGPDELFEHHIRVLPAGPVQEDFSAVKSQVNDLTIQRKLADMLQAKAISAPGVGTVYVIFLAPEVRSSLGGHKPAAEYVAYHNFFHAQPGEVHYVVVPFAGSADTQRNAAARALTEAALNPRGDGWY
jgi:hypothetical protein